jgi:hypothetical protein
MIKYKKYFTEFSTWVFTAILGIPRKCPKEPLAETWWDIQECEEDKECWPRICCPDGRKKYCRASQPLFEEATSPIARNLAYRK